MRATPRIANIVKKNIASPIIPPKLSTDSNSVLSSNFIEGIAVNSLRGLSSLNALSAESPFPAPPPILSIEMISVAAELPTTKKSSQFHPSERYELEPKANPIAEIFSRNSR